TDLRLDGCAAPRLLGQAVFPFRFRFQVGPMAQGTRELGQPPALDPSRVARGSTVSFYVPPYITRDAARRSAYPAQRGSTTAAGPAGPPRSERRPGDLPAPVDAPERAEEAARRASQPAPHDQVEVVRDVAGDLVLPGGPTDGQERLPADVLGQRNGLCG